MGKERNKDSSRVIAFTVTQKKNKRLLAVSPSEDLLEPLNVRGAFSIKIIYYYYYY